MCPWLKDKFLKLYESDQETLVLRVFCAFFAIVNAKILSIARVGHAHLL